MEVHIEMNVSVRFIQYCKFKDSLLADSSQSDRSEKVLSKKYFETSKYEKKNLSSYFAVN